MSPEQEKQAGRAIAWIGRHWSSLIERMPPGCPFFALGFGKGNGCCTSPSSIKAQWLRSYGGEVFAGDADVPDEFFACGTQNQGGSEYVFGMWRKGERRFWFFDQHTVYADPHSASSPARTRERLDVALARWEQGEQFVIFSGPHGWFDAATGKFVGNQNS